MTLRTSLPYDYARCHGKEVDGKAVIPCNNCARREFRNQVHELRQPWAECTPVMGSCSQFIDMEYEDAK